MKKVLIDTDVIIDYLRVGIGPLEKLLTRAGKGEIKLYISAITILELFTGEIKREQIEFVVDIEKRIEVVNVDKELAKFLGGLRKGIRTSTSATDLIIGGSAVYLEAEVATRNKKHFELIPGIKFYK